MISGAVSLDSLSGLDLVWALIGAAIVFAICVVVLAVVFVRTTDQGSFA